jgi:hypothetical protein
VRSFHRAEDEDRCRTTLVDHDLVDRAFEAVDERLRHFDESLHRIVIRVAEPRQADEEHRHRAEFCQPSAVASLDPGDDRARHEGPHVCIDDVGHADAACHGSRGNVQRSESELRPTWLGIRLLSQALPCGRRQYHLARQGRLKGSGQLTDRISIQNRLPRAIDAAQERGPGAAGANRNAEPELHVGDGGKTIELSQELETAGSACRGDLRRRNVGLERRPERQRRVTGEIEHLAACGFDDVGQRAEALVDDFLQPLGAAIAVCAQEAIDDRGKAGYVSQQNAGIDGNDVRLLDREADVSQQPKGEPGDIRHERHVFGYRFIVVLSCMREYSLFEDSIGDRFPRREARTGLSSFV